MNQNRQVGVTAQEVEAVLPELVRASDDGIKTVDYPKLNALLIETIKELNKENNKLKQDNRKLHESVSQIKVTLCLQFKNTAFCD